MDFMRLRNGFAKWKENGFKKTLDSPNGKKMESKKHSIRQMERKWNQKNLGFAKWKNNGMKME